MSIQDNFREVSDPAALPREPLVSVQMFAYRHEHFLAGAIEGVISQICNFPIELIIGEDCSPDGTLAIALDYQRRYPKLIRVLTADRNVGGHANVARSQSASRGKYIALHDGDDYWHNPHKLQMQVDLMESNPDMTFCHTDFDRKTRFRTWRNKHRNHPTPWLAQGDAYLALLHEWSVMTATTMFRRGIIDAFMLTDFHNIKWPFGDRNLILFSSLFGKVGYIDCSTATYRKIRNSSLNSGTASFLSMPLAAEECIQMFLDKHPVSATDELEILSRLKMNIYHASFYAENMELAQSTFKWLDAHGMGPSLARHRLRMAAITLKFPVRILRIVKNFIDLHLSSIPA